MHWYAAACVVLLSVTGMASYAQVNQEMIDRVAAGEIAEARASWWGFNEEDVTEALQAAIDSGAETLIVENMGAPWIVRPIELAGNQEIIFEEGCEVLAKRGEFHDHRAALFSARAIENLRLVGYGATFRMWRDDYDDPEQYESAAGRHALALRGVANVDVHGLTLRESGGDGIYLGMGQDERTNLNVHIKDVVCESNYRQGISVITAENLLIEDTIMRDTRGNPPQAGIDLEPNRLGQHLINVVLRNCLTENNAGAGYTFNLLPLNAESEPVSVRIENSRSVNDGGYAARILTDATLDESVTGSIEFVDCIFVGSRRPGITVTKPAERGLVRFERCEVLDCAVDLPRDSPIMLASRAGANAPVGGVEFVDVIVRDPRDRNPMGYVDQGGVSLEGVVGNLILIDDDGNPHDVPLDRERIAEWMPINVITEIPRLQLDRANLVPMAPDAPDEDVSWPFVRRAVELLLFAEAGDGVSFTVNHLPVGDRRGRDLPVAITAPSREWAHQQNAPFREETVVSFVAPETGIYAVELDVGSNRFQITASSHPLALSVEEGPINFIRMVKDLVFYVPAGTEHFGVRISGGGPGGAVAATLIAPDGEVFDEVDNQYEMHQFDVALDDLSPGEVWTLQIRAPSDTTWMDHFIELRGIPPLLAPAGTPLLVPAGD